MNIEQKRLVRHALGLPNDGQKSYRNRYLAMPDSPGGKEWQGMADAGLAQCGTSTVFGGQFYHLTRAGAERALVEGESLDLEDFPPIGAH